MKVVLSVFDMTRMGSCGLRPVVEKKDQLRPEILSFEIPAPSRRLYQLIPEVRTVDYFGNTAEKIEQSNL